MGEGIVVATPGNFLRAKLCQMRRILLPLLGGEGWGEGETML